VITNGKMAAIVPVQVFFILSISLFRYTVVASFPTSVALGSSATTEMLKKVPMPEMRGPEPDSLPFSEYKEDNGEKRKLLFVRTTMNYATADTLVAHVRRNIEGSDGQVEDAEWSFAQIRVHIARGADMKLDDNGFELVENCKQYRLL